MEKRISFYYKGDSYVLMMEQANACECHCHAESVAGFNYIIITNGAAGLCHVGHTGAVRALDVVAKREERVAAQRNACLLIQPRALFFLRQRFGALGEEALPAAVRQHLVRLVGDEHVNCVVAVGTGDFLHERQCQHTRMLPQQPVIRLLPCQTRAVNAALLPRADANRLTVLGVADGIRLRVFEHNQRHNQGEEGQFECGGAVVRKNADHRLVIGQRRAEVAVQQAAKIVDVLHNQRAVIAGRVDALLEFGGCQAAAQGGGNRVAGGAHHEEHDGDQNENGGNNEKEPRQHEAEETT